MLKKLKQTLQVLTYRDMVDFSTMVSERLPPSSHSPEDVADTLLDLPIDTDDEQVEKTNDILSRVFSRKKQITIQPQPEGIFKICCPAVDGAVVFEKNIREGVSQLLDTLTVLQAFDDD